MSAVLAVESERSTCGQKELERKASTSAHWLDQSGGKHKARRGSETERWSGQEKPGVTQSESRSSPWCKGRVSLREAEGRTSAETVCRGNKRDAEACRAAHRVFLSALHARTEPRWAREEDPPSFLYPSADKRL